MAILYHYTNNKLQPFFHKIGVKSCQHTLMTSDDQLQQSTQQKFL